MTFLRHVNRRSRGQGLVEYGLILALVVVGILVVLNLLGISVRDAYCQTARGLGVEACEAQTGCQDTFDAASENGEISGWDIARGKWDIRDGKLCGGPGQGTIYNKCSQSADVSDYTITLDSATLERGNGYGIYFRTTQGKHGLNGYTFQYDPGYGPGAFIFRKWVNGHELRPFAVKFAPGFDWHGSPHDVQLVVQGDTFTAYVDGVPMVTGVDDSYSEGSAGLRTWDGTNVCFDGFDMETNP